jgi:ABC-type branched-subunit amino acid transport system substrate-binding protein
MQARAVRAMGAFAAIVHINSRNSSVVEEAAELPDGFCITPLLLDSEFSPAGGVNAALAARAAGVIAVVGPSRSSAAQPLANVMMVTATPVVSNAASSPSLSSESTFPLFSRTIPNDLAAAQSMARLMLENYGWRRLGIMYVDDAYGTSYFQAFLSGCTMVAEDLKLEPGEYEVNGAAITPWGAEAAMQRLKSRGVTVYALVLLGDSIEIFLDAAIELEMVGLGYTCARSPLYEFSSFHSNQPLHFDVLPDIILE